MARECTQAWGPLFPVSRSTDHSMETDEVPAATASVIAPVNMTSIAHVPVSTAVITTAATVSTVPATVPSTSVNSSAAPVSTSFSTVTATAAATDSTCSVSTVSSVPSTSGASTASVPKSKKSRSVTAKIFRKHLAKYYSPVEIPSFDNVTGKECDSRARAYIKQQVQSMFVDKRIKLTNGGLVTWTELEVYECSLEICRILSFKNYLTEFIHTFVKSYWTNAKNVSKGKT